MTCKHQPSEFIAIDPAANMITARIMCKKCGLVFKEEDFYPTLQEGVPRLIQDFFEECRRENKARGRAIRIVGIILIVIILSLMFLL